MPAIKVILLYSVVVLLSGCGERLISDMDKAKAIALAESLCKTHEGLYSANIFLLNKTSKVTCKDGFTEKGLRFSSYTGKEVAVKLKALQKGEYHVK